MFCDVFCAEISVFFPVTFSLNGNEASHHDLPSVGKAVNLPVELRPSTKLCETSIHKWTRWKREKSEEIRLMILNKSSEKTFLTFVSYDIPEENAARLGNGKTNSRQICVPKIEVYKQKFGR